MQQLPSSGSSAQTVLSVQSVWHEAEPIRRSTQFAGTVSLMLAALLLGVGALLTTDPAKTWLVVGWSVEMIAALWWAFGTPLERHSRFLPVGVFSLIAVIWLSVCPPQSVLIWYVPLSHALLLLAPVVLFAGEFASQIGLPELRKARKLVRRLLRRHQWPEPLRECRKLPEVRALREVLQHDATPAWALLNDPRIPVKIAGLGALEFRSTWKPGQPEFIVNLLHSTDDPDIRAASVRALGGIDDHYLNGLFYRLLKDPRQRVRRAALEVILTKAIKDWSRYRNGIRELLGDPRFADEGALNQGLRIKLPEEAVSDLSAWANDRGTMAMRATLTLITHFQHLLANPSPELITYLTAKLMNPKVPAMVRVELAHLLRAENCLHRDHFRQLLPNNQPTSLRLLAAEEFLTQDPKHEESLAVLRGLARQPNREVALRVASILQRCLQLDLGLPWDQPNLSPHTKLAAEVTRRVMAWALHADMEVSPSPDSDAHSTSWAIDLPDGTPVKDRQGAKTQPRPDSSGWDF